MASGEFRVGDLRAVIGDNSADGEHGAGYNGVWSLTSRHESRNLFVPAYAGLNLEHIYDGHDADPAVRYEPRVAEMRFTGLDDATAQLHQPATPSFGLESIATFTLREPCYVDLRFECMAHRESFHHGYVGLFWASYVNAPDDKSLYFRSRDRWTQFCTQRHNDESSVLPDLDGDEMPTFSDGYPDMLYTNRSPLRFTEPFYYGLFGKMVYLLMFDRKVGIRFSHSPSGGGDSARDETTNPAWDWQVVIPNCEVGRRYEFRARVVYKPFESRADVLDEYRGWSGSL